MNGMGHYEVKAVGRGSVNKALRGLYTSLFEAKKKIDGFQPKAKVVKNDKKHTDSGV